MGGILGFILGPSRARTALPWGATDVNEFYQDYGILPDFVRVLRARIDSDDFDGYARRLGLNRNYSTDRSPAIQWPRNCNQDWWNPPESLENARYQYSDGDEYFAVAVYHEGFVYFAASSW